MGRTENPTDRLEASRGHRHWAKEIGPNQPLFRVDHGVRPKNNLTEPALLEMSGYATYQDLDASRLIVEGTKEFEPLLLGAYCTVAESAATPHHTWRRRDSGKRGTS